MSRDKGFNDQLLHSARDQAAEWFVRMHDRALSVEEQRIFERWLNANPLNRKEYQAVKDIWWELDGLKGVVSTTDSGNLFRLPGKRVWRNFALTASMVIFIVAGLSVLPNNTGSYETAKGVQRMLQLADNTVVRLNSDSLLQVELTEEQRTLHLHRGEAYFDVAHDPARAFVVMTTGGSSRAIGTRFNVYCQPSKVRVTVVEGSVEITTGNGEKRLLNAEQVVSYGTDGGAFSAVERQNSHDLDWLDNRIYFEAAPLIEVVVQLNRYLETPLSITDPDLNELKLSGAFDITNLESFPELLPRLLPVSLENTGDSVLLRRAN
jgi:transmembrane sensor